MSTCIPLRFVGPILICGESGTYSVDVPLATFESPLWPSVARGAKVSRDVGGISVTILDDGMARSILIDARTAKRAAAIVQDLKREQEAFFSVAHTTSRYLICKELDFRVIGSLVYLRLRGSTGDASGHNIITKAADAVLQYVCQRYPDVVQISVSGNYCTDKKVSSVNAILGRGKSVVADLLLSRDVCKTSLRTSPEAIVELNAKKNLLGSIINGGVQTANAHFANMLLAIYLATGQDAANIVEGSQGIVHAEAREEGLYFSVSLPNIIVGTVGSGKNEGCAREALERLGCCEERPVGANARRLAEIVGATVLCGELSLLAAQTNPGELVRTHITIERRNKDVACRN